MPKMAEAQVLKGRDIRAERCGQRLTQTQLAKRLGTNLHLIVAIEREHVQLTQEDYRRILEAINELATASP